MYDKSRLENNAKHMSEVQAETDQFHRWLLEIALEYGEHKEDCHKFGTSGSIENDCSCAWGPIGYYLRVLQRRLQFEDGAMPAHYDSPDNNAWTRANYGLPPEPGDPGFGEKQD